MGAPSGKWKLVASHKASETSDQPFRLERLRKNKEAGLKETPESRANCAIIRSWTRKRSILFSDFDNYVYIMMSMGLGKVSGEFLHCFKDFLTAKITSQ